MGRSWVLRKVRAARLLAQEQFRLSFEAAPIGLALVSPDGRFLRVNPALCQVVGYSEEELLATTFQALTHPDDLDADVALAEAVLSGERSSYRLDKRYLRRDGSVVDVQLDVTLVRDDMGRPLHFISQVQDVSERNRTVAELHATQAIQSASLDALEQGVAVVDMSGQVRLLNRAGSEILDCSADELASNWHERWETYHEDGSHAEREDRPIVITLTTGEAVDGLVGFWRATNGTLRTLRVRTEPVYGDNGEMVGAVAAFADITEHRLAERAKQVAMQELEWRANHDMLTGLPNRGVLQNRLDACLERGRPAGLLFVDLDHFKSVNDTLGHECGDDLLTEVAHRIVRSVRTDDTVARFGGDEFVVLAEGIGSAAEAEDLAHRIGAELALPFRLGGELTDVSASIGIAFGRDMDAADLLRRADVALYRAKSGGRDQHVVFEQPT